MIRDKDINKIGENISNFLCYYAIVGKDKIIKYLL